MKTHSWWRSDGRRAAALSLGVLALLPGCVGEESAPVPLLQPDEGAGEPAAPLPAQSAIIGEFDAHLSPSRRAMTFTAVRRAAGGDLSAQSVDDLNVIQDLTPGSGPPGTVELVTNSVGFDSQCPTGYKSHSFCGNVTLRHFYTGILSNAFVQVLSVTNPTTGADMIDHGGTNGDPSEFGLDATRGLWKYTSSASSSPGVLAESPYNSGTRDWVFSNPDDADITIRMRIVASLSYASYTMDFSSQPFIDACSVGTNLGPVASATQTMPFPFTLYASTSATVKFNKRGMITFGNVNGTVSGINVELPTTAAPRPALFPFWDDIAFGASSSGICYAALGAAPNRQYVIQWKNMNFTAAADRTASLNFEAILSEGTNQIDLVYGTMSGPTSRTDGDSATVGVQNAAGTAATGEFNLADFGSGNAYSLFPVP